MVRRQLVRHDLRLLSRSRLGQLVFLATVSSLPLGAVVGWTLAADDRGSIMPVEILLGMWFIVSFVVPFSALLIAGSGIVRERESGTIRLLLNGAIDRRDFFVSKICSLLVFSQSAVLLGGVLSTVVLLSVPTQVLVIRTIQFFLFSILLCSGYVAIGIVVSTIARSYQQAWITTALVFVATLVWPQLVTIASSSFGGDTTRELLQFVGRLSPFAAYTQAVSEPPAILAVEVTTPLLGPIAMFLVLAFWATVPLRFAARRFENMEIK